MIASWRVLGLLVAVTGGAGCSQAPPAARPGAVPQRIASLTLASDEILVDLVPVERVIAVTYLADDAQISNVAGRYPASVPRLRDTAPERVVAMAPDLVCVAPYNSADFLAVLERSGLTTYRNEALHSLDEIERGIVALGECVGEPARAAELTGRLRARRQQLAEQVGRVNKRPRVLYWSAGFTAGSDTTINDMIREAGAVNIAAEHRLRGSAEVSPEQVIAFDPEIVLLARWSADDAAGRIEDHPLLRNLPAVRAKRIVRIDGRYLLCVSQHAIEGAERLARQLHPECFEKQPAASGAEASP